MRKILDGNVIGLILGYKVLVLFVIFLSYSLLPFDRIFYFVNFVYPPKQPITLQTAYKTWDGFHYLYLSEQGYHPNDPSNAFPPLFPFLIHITTFITHSSFWSAIVISNLCSFFAFYLFYLLVKKIKNAQTAYMSLVFSLAFPTTFYTSLVYTESLFLLLVMLFFYSLYSKRIVLAPVCAFILPFVKVLAVGIFLPFVVWYVFDFCQFQLTSQVLDIGKAFLKKSAISLASPFLGFGLLLIFMKILTGDYFAQFDAQKFFISQYSLMHSINILYFFHMFFQFPLVLHGYTNSLLDRIFFVGFLLLLIPMRKLVSPVFFVYALVFGIGPVMAGSFMSYMRYLSVVFPLSITIVLLVQKERYQFLQMPILFLFLMLQTLFICMHSLNYWVG